MKDQPFKRYFPSDRGTEGQSYKYPTYKHYYQPKKSKLGEKSQQNKNQQNRASLLDAQKNSNILFSKSNRSNLKKQLQNLKFQVHKIMEQKQNLLRTSVQKNTSPQFQTHKGQKNQSELKQALSQSILGRQSIQSQELQHQIKVTNQSYVAKHTQTQNSLLTIQLKNLKNRYLNKKKELKQKCNELEKKVILLQDSLQKLQQSSKNQIQTLKLQLQQAKKSNISQKLNEALKENQAGLQLYSKLKYSQSRVLQLEQQINQLKKNGLGIQKKQPGKNNSLQLQSKLDLSKKEFQYKLQLAKGQIKQLKGEISNINNAKTLLQQQIKYLHSQKKLNEEKIEELNNKIQLEKDNCEKIQQIYKVNLQAKQKQYQQLLKNIQSQYKKRSKASNQKIQGSQQKAKNQSQRDLNNEESVLQKQVKKWKIQYKLLKDRYQSHVGRENKNKKEFEEYYSTYRQSKNKLQIYTHKINILEKQLENYMNLLTGKQNQLMKKQIEIRRITDEQALQIKKHTDQIQALTDRYKRIEDKYNEQLQKHQKEVIYRKQIQQKILSSSDVNDSSLKEVIDRMKKRLIQQDQKMSKNIKQLKSKDTLNTKLKQQLRQTIQNLQQKINFQKNQQINKIIEEYTQKQSQALSSWKQKTEKQIKLLEQNNNKLIQQILTLKNQLNKKDQQLISGQNELKIMKSSYNIKCFQHNDALQQKQLVIKRYIQELQEAEILKKHVQNVLKQQIQRKNQEINSLREDLLSKITKNQTFSKYNPSFDDILKSHMETSTKLRDDANKKTEEIFKLRDNYSTLRSQYQNLKSQIDINKLKMLSEKKNIEVNYQIEIQNLKNQIAGQQKKMASLQQKIKVVIEQNKKKDNFIQTYMMGKKLPQNEKDLVSAFINKYQIALGSADIMQRLQFDTKQLQKLNIYNSNLLKQVSLLKQKLLLFEAIDQQKLSLYESQSRIEKGQQTNIKEGQFQQIAPRKKSPLKKAQSLHIASISQLKSKEIK